MNRMHRRQLTAANVQVLLIILDISSIIKICIDTGFSSVLITLISLLTNLETIIKLMLSCEQFHIYNKYCITNVEHYQDYIVLQSLSAHLFKSLEPSAASMYYRRYCKSGTYCSC
jgi:hypothetical protein